MADNFGVLFFLFIHFLDLSSVYQDHISQKIINDDVRTFLRLDHILNFQEQFENKDKAILAWRHQISSARTEAQIGSPFNMKILTIHHNGSLQSSKNDEFAIIQRKNQSFFGANRNLSHINNFSIKFMLTNSVILTVMLL